MKGFAPASYLIKHSSGSQIPTVPISEASSEGHRIMLLIQDLTFHRGQSGFTSLGRAC